MLMIIVLIFAPVMLHNEYVECLLTGLPKEHVHVLLYILEGARASTGLHVDVSSGVMI